MNDKVKEILDRYLEESNVCCDRESGYIDGWGDDSLNDIKGIYAILESAMLEFGRLACEEQKLKCIENLDGIYITKVATGFILKAKNVCDER